MNGEEWLPASADTLPAPGSCCCAGSGVGGLSTFSDYPKFSVTTDTAVKPPQ